MTKKHKEQILFDSAPKDINAVNLWLCYPYTYKYGISSLGFLNLYRLFDENPNANIEKIFSDTTETRINKPELAGFSFSFECDFLGVFKILEKYNIPLLSKERTEDNPLVFGGGPVLTANSEPYADFFDFVIIGDGEEVTDKIIEVYNNNKNSSKKDILLELAQIKGIYVPSFYEPEYKKDGTIACYRKLENKAPEIVYKSSADLTKKCASSSILSNGAFLKDTYQIEVMRGCPKECKFCNASHLNLPARCPDKTTVLTAIEEGLKHTDKIHLIGASISHHPDFEGICEGILQLRKFKPFSIDICTLEVDKITHTQAKTLSVCGQSHLSLSIEGISQRLREEIGRNITEQEIINCIEILKSNGIKSITLYMLLGFEGENQHDIQEFNEFLAKIKTTFPEINFMLMMSTFIPKAQTPYERMTQETPASIESKKQSIKETCDNLNITSVFSNPKWDFVQSLLSRGDRRLTNLLLQVHKLKGSINSWKSAYNSIKSTFNLPEDIDWYVYRQRENTEVLGWNIIDLKPQNPSQISVSSIK